MNAHGENRRLPFRRAERPRRRGEGEARVEAGGAGASVVPMRVRIEVRCGRHSTVSAMGAYRVTREIEETGGAASVIELAPDGSALVAEMDAAQARRLAGLPLVRRVVTLN